MTLEHLKRLAMVVRDSGPRASTRSGCLVALLDAVAAHDCGHEAVRKEARAAATHDVEVRSQVRDELASHFQCMPVARFSNFEVADAIRALAQPDAKPVCSTCGGTGVFHAHPHDECGDVCPDCQLSVKP